MENANQFEFDADLPDERRPETGGVQVRPFSLAELPAFLPAALDRIAPSRAVVVADQIRAAIANGAAESMILLVTESSDAMAIVLPQTHGDMATVLHAGPMGPSIQPSAEQSETAAQLGRTLGQICAQRAIGYLQWATVPTASQIVAETTKEANWPSWMGFKKIGDLRYLSLDFASQPVADLTPTRLKPVHVPDRTTAMEGLQALIQQTYVDSLDCPTLERFRSAEEIMRSYRDVPSFAPDLWFTLHESDSVQNNEPQDPVGCLLLSRHGTESDPVIELLYMGVVPESRGRGFSADILTLVLQCCEQESAERLILAVDQTNTPAVQAYERIGMQTILCETVWARRVQPDRS